jgi:hypothetical protein
MLLDVVTKNLYPTKYPIIVMIMLDLVCDEVKGFCLNFQGMSHSYSNPYCWISLKIIDPRYGIHSRKAT